MTEVKAPDGSQLLIFPMMDCTISGGFKNARYRKDYGYIHYGVDFDSKRAVDFMVLASGTGTVLGVEKNQNSIGGVIVIKYPKAYDPKRKRTKDLILRYYHLSSIAVKKGDTVTAYQKIGTVSGSHKWWNHVHVEIDTDTKYPFHTPQVAEASSKLLIRKGATATSLLDPMTVFVIGKQQEAKVHSLAIHADKVKDAPKYYEAG